MSQVLGNPKKCEAVSEPLHEKSIRRHLSAQGSDDIKSIHVFSSISSTNDYLLENALDNKQVAVCVAEQQTQGRGRYGHQWVSPAAVNLYLSMSWPLRDWREEYETLSLWLLIAIAEILEKHGCSNIQLKWPNDLCVRNKKLAGVLLERKVSQTKNALVMGVGLNVGMSLRNDVKIETPWTDLLSIKSDWDISRNELAANVIDAIHATISELEKGRLESLDSKWKQYDMLLSKRIEFLSEGKINSGYVKGVDDLGKIILDLGGKLEHMHCAHISEIKIIGNTL